AESLLSGDNIRRLLVDMPATFTGFHPLGYVLVVMLGAGVAERSGFFGTAMSGAVAKAPIFLLTPAVAFIGMVGNLAADAAYVVLIPLAGVVFAAAGRHPIAGIAAAFAGVSGGFSANILPGQLDALLFGITEAAAETIQPAWDANIAGNAYFIIGMTFVFLPAIWFVTDKIIEPKLGPINPDDLESSTAGVIKDANSPLSIEEVAGLKRAGMACLGIVALWVFLTIGPGTPLIDEGAIPQARYNPLFQSLVAGFFILFLAAGWAYGSATGSVRSHRDIVKMMSGAMGDLAYYLVLAFAAAHFVAMFNWSNLGLIFAIKGAAVLESSNLPDPLLLSLIIIIGAIINLFIGSASAKWALLAPVLVPMLMLIGISPEMSTAAYRVGDGATNIITPLMPYFPLILIFCQRWQKEFGLGSLVATMLPYSMTMLFAGILMTVLWVVLGIPLGPNSPVGFSL
ncbi:MAG: aminobenzoyl-glutamate transport protein, partial [Gammaproteobacteria bacterium]